MYYSTAIPRLIFRRLLCGVWSMVKPHEFGGEVKQSRRKGVVFDECLCKFFSSFALESHLIEIQFYNSDFNAFVNHPILKLC